MASPDNIKDIIDVSARFVPSSPTGAFGFTDPMAVAEFAATASFPDLIKAYAGDPDEIRISLINDGFTPGTETYGQVNAFVSQKNGPPARVFVGRKEPGPSNWSGALDAIYEEAFDKQLAPYAFAVTTRDVFDIEEIEDWTQALNVTLETRPFVLYIGQTDSATVINNTPGNLAATVLAKNRENPRLALLWHDPATASGFGPATLTSISSSSGFNIPDGSTLLLRVDGGAEQAFDFNALPAIDTGSIAEPFAIADGDDFTIAANGAPPQTVIFSVSAATVINTAPEFYDIPPGSLLNVRVDGVTDTVTFAAAPGSFTTSAETYAIVAGETVELAIDGGPDQLLTFTIADIAVPGAATSSEVATAFSNFFTGVTVLNNGTSVTVTSLLFGTDSNVEIVSGTAVVALGLAVGNNAGTGFAGDASAATAIEVRDQITADVLGATCVLDGALIRITSNTVGTDSEIQVVSGVANQSLKFPTNAAQGAGDFKDASAVEAGEVVAKFSDYLNGVIVSEAAGAVVLTSRINGEGSSIAVLASTAAPILGFAVGTEVGSGDFLDASQAKASEIANHIAETLAGAASSSVSSAVVITSDTSGDVSELEITGGTIAGVLAFTGPNGEDGFSTGTGVEEDWLDCAWIGRCITFNLDAPRGVGIWDNHTLVGVFADKNIKPSQRKVLEETLKTNTYRNRNARDETHTGTMLSNISDAGRYIDVRTTLDWYKARASEGFKRIQNELADQKKKLDYEQAGADVYGNFLRSLVERADTAGHTFKDQSILNPDDSESTGVFVPNVLLQTDASVDARQIAGYALRQRSRSALQRATLDITIIRPIPNAA